MSRAKPGVTVPADKLELYTRLIQMRPEITRKGDSVPYTSVNGHMFSFLSASGELALRLPPAEREEFVRVYETKLVEAYGVLLKEYVAVPDRLLQTPVDLLPWLDASYRYTSALKPKKTAPRTTAGPKKAVPRAAKKTSSRKRKG
jgi:hypothetical protein